MPYYDECPDCGANLDPGEKCSCRKEIEKYERKVSDLIEIEKCGQFKLKVG